MSTPAIDFWDLDHTLLSTRELLAPFYDRLAAKLGCTRDTIPGSYTLEGLFEMIGLPPEEWEVQRASILQELAHQQSKYVISEAIDILAERAKTATQVLVSSGNPDWQQAKFNVLTKLHTFFAPDNVHFVTFAAPKDAIIGKYLGNKTFVDDSATNLKNVSILLPDVHLIRPMWPSEHRAADPNDGKLWTTATNANELRAAFDAVNKTIDG